VIGRSLSDAQPVFDTIVKQSVRLWEAAFGFVLRFDGKIISVAAHYINPRLVLALRRGHFHVAGSCHCSTDQAMDVTC
jgi:hypothetical protein